MNGWSVQLWGNGEVTKELCIVSAVDGNFARLGDSGGCLFKKGIGAEILAGGQVIGKNSQLNDLTLWTPIQTLIEDAASKIAGVR